MNQLVIGDTVIDYAVRPSAAARDRRIVVTPEGVVVVVPQGSDERGARAFVERKRRWIFDAVREIAEQHQALLAQQYRSGAKLQYRGRWLMLEVVEANEIHVQCRSKFHVRVPAGLHEVEKTEVVREALEGWLRARATEDMRRLGRRFERLLGVSATGYRLSDARARWGSTGKDGVVRIHWQLVQAPVAALEYVVAHEVTHLLHRDHSPAFWRALATALPDWRERKAMLERWERERRAV